MQLTRGGGRLGLAAAGLLLAAAAVAAGLTASVEGHAASDLPVRTLARAERTLPGASAPTEIVLPDRWAPDAATATQFQVNYRWQLDLPADADAAAQARSDLALYFSGLRAWGRLSVNGQTVLDTTASADRPAPRGLDALALAQVPPATWLPGRNTVELQAMGTRAVWVSPLQVGPAALLTQHLRWRALGTVIGPALVSAVVGTLGLSMLFLWWRRRERLYAYFGLGVLGWALHTLWTVAPSALLPWLRAWPELHYRVWWNVLYGFFVAMVVLFCIRFADWRWPRFERAVLAGAALSPLLLYAALAADGESAIPELWRLGLVVLAAVALVALVRAARRSPQRDKVLITIVGAAAVAAAVHDWSLGDRDDNNPVFWVPYVGLLFVAFVMRILIDRFLHATRGLEALNAELGQRVAEQHTELRLALEQMRRSRDAAEAADQAKTRFLAAASHDLRQPAHALGLYMATLRAGPLAAEQAETAQRMAASLAALDSMFTALLDVSRIDAGAVVPQWEVVALAPLLRRLADEWAGQAEARGLRLSLHMSDAAAMTVTDPLLLERVLRNLMANAVKYSGGGHGKVGGGVLLACRIRTQADGSRGLRIEVWDTGIGIAEADRERVFEEFYQVGNPGRDRASGLGLGLAIVRRLVRLLQLRLVLHSRPGRGSVFLIDDLSLAGRALQQAAAARTEMRRLAGTVVAVIEDDAEVRDAMRGLLRLWECHVVDGGSAADVLRQLREAGSADLTAPTGAAPVDAVVADVRLAHGRRGPDEARALFAAWGSTVPLLLVSGETAPEHLRALERSGHTCLTKPVSPARLRTWLEHATAAAAPHPAGAAAATHVP